MMARRLTGVFVAALAIAALAAPAANAGGFDNEFQGIAENDPGTYFGFDVVKENGKTKIKKVQAVLGYACEDGGGGGLAYAKGRGSLIVKDGRFSGKVRITEFLTRGGTPLPGSGYVVKGKVPKNGKAKGTVDAELIFAAARGGNTSVCYSGRLDWKVSDEAPIRAAR